MTRSPKVIVVGAGVAGIATGKALKDAGFHDFRIIEKADDVGGVWQWNHYPGLSCDVPSQLYQFSFATKPDWPRVFATGPQIQRYLRAVVDHNGLAEHLTLGTEVRAARFDGTGWEVTTDEGADRCDFVVCATGILHHPNVPDFEGREEFEGDVVHTARWDDGVETAGKRIAVVGNGSTGVQIVTALQPVADRLTLYSRHPQWVIRAPTDAPQPRALTRVLRNDAVARAYYRMNLASSALLVDIVTRPTWRRRAAQGLARRHHGAVRDPILRERLRPDYEPFCKRQVVSGGFHRAVQQPNVEVLREGIERFTPGGLKASDGSEREHDLVILATGFKAHNYMRPMDLVGRGGITIEDQWRQGPRAYRMTAIPGFPNLFTVLGPNSPIGSLSQHQAAEMTGAYIAAWLRRWAAGEFDTVEVTEAATEAFNAQVRTAMPSTVWASGCDSWYLTENGDVDLWPFDGRTMRRMLSAPDPADFTLAAAQAGEPAKPISLPSGSR